MTPSHAMTIKVELALPYYLPKARSLAAGNDPFLVVGSPYDLLAGVIRLSNARFKGTSLACAVAFARTCTRALVWLYNQP